jgi:hypothetical protein
MSKLPNYCKYLFLFSGRLRRRGGLRLTTWLIHYKKPDSHPAVLLNSFKFCPPVVFIWFWLFLSCLRERSFECVWVGGLRLRYYNFFPIIAFHFFFYHKINLHVGISTLEQLFPLCFLRYESFSNCQQSYYRNMGYFGEIYKYMWEFDISPANWKKM